MAQSRSWILKSLRLLQRFETALALAALAAAADNVLIA